MKKAVIVLLLLSIISNSYAYPTCNIGNDIINAINAGIKDIINAVIDVIKSLLNAVVGVVTYPFKLLAGNFEYSSRWWNNTLGGFSPIGYIIVVALSVGIIFWFIDKYVDIGLG
jgi:hypothetical protein